MLMGLNLSCIHFLSASFCLCFACVSQRVFSSANLSHKITVLSCLLILASNKCVYVSSLVCLMCKFPQQDFGGGGGGWAADLSCAYIQSHAVSTCVHHLCAWHGFPLGWRKPMMTLHAGSHIKVPTCNVSARFFSSLLFTHAQVSVSKDQAVQLNHNRCFYRNLVSLISYRHIHLGVTQQVWAHGVYKRPATSMSSLAGKHNVGM